MWWYTHYSTTFLGLSKLRRKRLRKVSVFIFHFYQMFRVVINCHNLCFDGHYLFFQYVVEKLIFQWKINFLSSIFIKLNNFKFYSISQLLLFTQLISYTFFSISLLNQIEHKTHMRENIGLYFLLTLTNWCLFICLWWQTVCTRGAYALNGSNHW